MRPLSVGIDIGSHQIKVIALEEKRDKGRPVPVVAGIGFAESRGLRHGYILNPNDVVKSLRHCLLQAEKSADSRIKKAYLSIGGIGLSSNISTGSVMISRGDAEITDLDVEKAVDISKREIPQNATVNRKIIHSIPLQYKIDGKVVLGRPHGMNGAKLEVKTLFITALEHHLNDLIASVEETGVSVEDVVAAPIAASQVTLTKSQKIAGSVLANIGSETVSIVVYENGIPVSLEVFPIGSDDITNDIALGLKISLEEAEDIKLGKLLATSYPRKKLEEIIEARLSDIFELIDAHLKKIGRSELLPAGIIITGGGSGIETIDDIAKAALRLPSRIAPFTLGDKSRNHIKDASWSVAYGLAVIGLSNDDGETLPGIATASSVRNKFLAWIKQFLP